MPSLRYCGEVKSVLGIDIGGSGVKGAPVNIRTGELLGKRKRIATPQPSTPAAVLEVVVSVMKAFNWKGRVGITVPGVVQCGVIKSAVNIDPGWVGFKAQKRFSKDLRRKVAVLNDADAAGIAEMRLGAAKGRKGVVFLATFGTGIGTALFNNGRLLPNTELGHIEINGADAELHAAGRLRKRGDLQWDDYAERVDDYLAQIERLLNPDLIVVGGGVSKNHEAWLHLLHRQSEVVPAHFGNNAGIIGAALHARRTLA